MCRIIGDVVEPFYLGYYFLCEKFRIQISYRIVFKTPVTSPSVDRHTRSFVSRVNKNGNDNRRGDLVRAAAQLFRQKGFEGTTIRDIAGAVGMRSGSPFYHFASKHELLLAVMEEGLRLGLERTR